MEDLRRFILSARPLLLGIVLLAGTTGWEPVAFGQDDPPSLEPLAARVTDQDSVLYSDEARDLEARLEEMYRTRDLNFYLVIRSQPLEQSASELAQRLQRATVTKGTGGVILVSFADNSVSLFLTEEALKIIDEKQLMGILEDATQSFVNERAVSLNIAEMTFSILNRVDSLRNIHRQRSQAAPFWAFFWVIVSGFVIALLVAGYYLLRRQNLFGRSYLFRPHEAVVRFGGGKSGGHSAEMTFQARSTQTKRRR